MLGPRARARLCPRLPHRRRHQRRLAHIDGHVPDDGREHRLTRLHRPERTRDVLRPLGHARRPWRDELGQFQFCRVHAVHRPIRRVRAARSCTGGDHPLPEVVIHSISFEQGDDDDDDDIYLYPFFFCFRWMIVLCHISCVGCIYEH